MVKNQRRFLTYSTDQLMVDVVKNLVRDFQDTVDLHFDFTSYSGEIVEGGNFRNHKFPLVDAYEPAVFKRILQLKNFLKRYTFAWEAKRDLNQECNHAFKATQSRIAQPLHLTNLDWLVLRKARSIVSEILGDYDREEHFAMCKFSSNATVGSSLRRSYLDLKLATTVSGSPAHIRWFSDYLLSDPLLSEIVVGSKFQPCECLSATNVPKSWEKLRTITPNTTLGSFHSYGLGQMIALRLKRVGLNINHLQEHHRKMACVASKTKHLVTADLSAASDSFGADLVSILVPRVWYNELNRGRARSVRIGDERVRLYSFMAMGIGFTFPLQTLLFYALLRSLQVLTGVRGHISVYGDDLLYPSALHKYVVRMFPRFRLLLNYEKTYRESSFRESCGGDYYRGIDVRPCQIEGVASELKRPLYATFIYKLVNSLRRRWDDTEITHTLDHLYNILYHIDGCVFQVPGDFPDYAGVCVDSINTDPRFYKPLFCKKTWSYRFKRYLEFPRKRMVKSEKPYYWNSLRASFASLPDPLYGSNSDTLELVPGRALPELRGKGLGKDALVAVVAMKNASTTLVSTGSGFA